MLDSQFKISTKINKNYGKENSHFKEKKCKS